MENIDRDYLSTLNPQQREAVVYDDGPSLVIAGAGSGKTRVLTYKIVHLLENGVPPQAIMALTFTNKAAGEMKSRIAQVVGEQTASRLWMGTFHSVFLRILRRHADLLGYKSSFTIYDAADSKSLVKIIVKELGLDEKIYRPNVVAAAISNAKNALVSADQYVADPDYYRQDAACKRPMTGRIYQLYCERCRMADAMDFDDILFNMNLLLRERPDIALHYQTAFKYILVDEYQDTNFAQHLIVSELAARHHRLFVVGDDAQSIYSFRGANIDNILGFEKRFPDTRIFKLERNYRSTKNIVKTAGSLIANNSKQIPKNVFSENGEGEQVRVVRTQSDIEEAFTVATKIAGMHARRHDSLDDYAVLYRTNAQSRLLEEALRKRDIPYRVYGGLAFYQRKEVKDAICYFRMAVNPDDDEALRRVINYPARGIGETTVKKIQSAAIAAGVSMWAVINDPEKYSLSINRGTASKLSAFMEIINESIDKAKAEDAYEAGEYIINRTGLIAVLAHDNTPESISRHDNLMEVLSDLRSFVDTAKETGEGTMLPDFLSQVSLRTDQDEETDTDRPQVTLLTVHAAKGLEFKHVIITGVEDDLFPSMLSKDSLSAIEEERRLLYVAITRAKETCQIIYARQRYRNGKTTPMTPSPFIMELDSRFVDFSSGGVLGRPQQNARTYRTTVAPQPVASFAPTPRPVVTEPSGTATTHSADELGVGMKIHHDKFGKGTITDITLKPDPIIKVTFEMAGEKKLLLRFAKFDILQN